MSAILTQAQALVQELITLMPTPYQQDSLQALLGLFLAATGSPLPQYCQIKSASALSRFLNQYQWSTRKIIKAVRSAALERILTQPSKGRKPTLQVIIDLQP
jgi:hypothetical protein